MLTDAGTVLCWGENGSGQLGLGVVDFGPHMTPTMVPTLTGVSDLAVGDGSSCALLKDGMVRCWGANGHGQLADGTTITRPNPTGIPGLSGVVAIALSGAGGAGEAHGCAITKLATLLCWGSNQYGQLGDGTTSDRTTPTPVAGLTGVKGVSVSWENTCALKDDGTVWCWGQDAKVDSEITCDLKPVLSPTPIYGATEITAITNGGTHKCGLKANGSVVCWGDNEAGELGLGSKQAFCSPQAVPSLSNVAGVVAIAHRTHVWRADGSVLGWGYNHNANLGDGDAVSPVTSPVVIAGLAGAIQVAEGVDHGCALQKDNAVLCWGLDFMGRLGSPPKANCSSGPCNVKPQPVQF